MSMPVPLLGFQSRTRRASKSLLCGSVAGSVARVDYENVPQGSRVTNDGAPLGSFGAGPCVIVAITHTDGRQTVAHVDEIAAVDQFKLLCMLGPIREVVFLRTPENDQTLELGLRTIKGAGRVKIKYGNSLVMVQTVTTIGIGPPRSFDASMLPDFSTHETAAEHKASMAGRVRPPPPPGKPEDWYWSARNFKWLPTSTTSTLNYV